MHFGKGYWKTFSAGIEREWVITNGLGGYCGNTIIGANARKHHGYLIASLHPPVERVAVVNKSDELLEDAHILLRQTREWAAGMMKDRNIFSVLFMTNFLILYIRQRGLL